MSFIETMPENDVIKLAERLKKYILSEPEQKNTKAINQTYNVKDAALLTTKSLQTIRTHIKIGLLEAKKVGKNYVITQENLLKYIENDK